jgi:hypothetical protein
MSPVNVAQLETQSNNGNNQKRHFQPSDFATEPVVAMHSLARGHKKRRAQNRQATHVHFEQDEQELAVDEDASLVGDKPAIDYDLGEPTHKVQQGGSVWTELISSLPSLPVTTPVHPNDMLLYRHITLGEMNGAWGPVDSGWKSGRVLAVDSAQIQLDILWRESELFCSEQNDSDYNAYGYPRKTKPRQAFAVDQDDVVEIASIIELKRAQ